MGGLLLFALFTASGLPLARVAFPRMGKQTRVWLGLVFGQVMMLWFPSLFAFFTDFTLAAQIAGGALAAALGTAACVWGRRMPVAVGRENEPPLWLSAALVLPLAAVMAYLQYTHILLPSDGYLLTGQATNGDLNLHMAIASCLADGGAFPPDYPIFDGVRLGYNFLSDALSASMMTCGSSLRSAFIVPAVFHTALAGWGFVMLAWQFAPSKRATALAFCLLFLNGGLGFMYVFDGVVADPSRLHEALYGFYRAPANMVDHNIRWSNILCDMLLPQRAMAPGWMMLTACLFLLKRSLDSGKKSEIVWLGILSAAMGMVHFHSLFALAVVSFAVLVCALFRKDHDTVRKLLLYAAVTAVPTLPQLIVWILPQASGSMHLQFDWVNNDGGRLIDDWLWFWVKNVGLVFPVFVPAFFWLPKKDRPMLLGAALTFVLAELVVFQKNVYDNNKVFYAAFLLALPAAARYLVAVYDRLKGIPGRRALACVFIAVSTLSGVVTVAREAISSYPLFSPAETEAMDWVRENTEKDALFLTGDGYISPVCELGGRNILCGTASFLYYHSIDYWDRTQDAYAMLQSPRDNLALFDRYGIDYIYVGSNELNDVGADLTELQALFTCVYKSNVYIFSLNQ